MFNVQVLLAMSLCSAALGSGPALTLESLAERGRWTDSGEYVPMSSESTGTFEMDASSGKGMNLVCHDSQLGDLNLALTFGPPGAACMKRGIFTINGKQYPESKGIYTMGAKTWSFEVGPGMKVWQLTFEDSKNYSGKWTDVAC